MSKIITLDTALTGTGPRILRTPGVGGYAARFIAGHLDLPDGAALSNWNSVAGTVPTSLVPTGAGSTVKVQEENGIRHVTSPGAFGTGGRLLGPHTSQRPLTVAGVFRAAPGAVDFAGMTFARFSRNANGQYQAQSVPTSAPLGPLDNNGWVFLLFSQTNTSGFTFRIDALETTRTAAAAPPDSSGGLYFGARDAGTAACRELIYWPKELSGDERTAVHQYFRTRYPELK